MNEAKFYQIIAGELNIRAVQVSHTVELLDAGNTVPFIARYRKEVTGKLDEEQIRDVEERIHYLRMLEERRETILSSIAEQEKLTPELEKKIREATKLQVLEDLYLPYRPKRRTRATIARERGLEPLADLMRDPAQTGGSPESLAAAFVDPEKDVADVEAALAGARDIVAEGVSDSAEVREKVREYTRKHAMLVSVAKDSAAQSDYEMY
ncbi:MAG: RNA-binding transcriptional accessory protein, partial [Calditrichaeota bacterium]|nr:RNA-binding transcriptional accessory protein [Calditrichota bacterium]